MRNRLYYNKEDITENLFTTGSEWMTMDNQEYIGAYHRYSDGLVFSRGTWDASLSKKLIPYVDLNNDILAQRLTLYKKLKPTIKTQYIVPEQKYITISEQDSLNGFIYRYFIKRFTGEIFEIDKIQYDQYQNKRIDPNLYTAVRVEWSISGPLNNNTKNQVLIKSIETKNRESIQIAARSIPELITYINNYSEFATDIDYNIPSDINQ